MKSLQNNQQRVSFWDQLPTVCLKLKYQRVWCVGRGCGRAARPHSANRKETDDQMPLPHPVVSVALSLSLPLSVFVSNVVAKFITPPPPRTHFEPWLGQWLWLPLWLGITCIFNAPPAVLAMLARWLTVLAAYFAFGSIPAAAAVDDDDDDICNRWPNSDEGFDLAAKLVAVWKVCNACVARERGRARETERDLQ